MLSYTIDSLKYYKSVNSDNQSFTCNKELVPSIYHYLRFIKLLYGETFALGAIHKVCTLLQKIKGAVY